MHLLLLLRSQRLAAVRIQLLQHGLTIGIGCHAEVAHLAGLHGNALAGAFLLLVAGADIGVAGGKAVAAHAHRSLAESPGL